MAGKDELEVMVEDENTVTVDVSDDPALAKAAELEVEAEVPKPKPKPANQQQATKQPAVDQATQVLTAAKDKAERDAAAAQATALAERQRREQAERIASQRTREAAEAQEAAAQGQMALIDNNIEATQGEVSALEAQLATALESGNFKDSAAIQSKLGKATARLDRLEAQKADYEAGVRKAPTTEGRVEEPTVPQGSAVDQYLGRYSLAAQAWLRAHPECLPADIGGNAQANAKMMRGHHLALAEGYPADSPDYYRVIEEQTGHRAPVSAAAETTAAGEEAEAPKPKPRTQKPPVAAAPSREPPTSRGLPPGQRQVTLTKEQAEIARLSFPKNTPQEAYALYARNLLELEGEGKMGRTSH